MVICSGFPLVVVVVVLEAYSDLPPAVSKPCSGQIMFVWQTPTTGLSYRESASGFEKSELSKGILIWTSSHLI